MNTRTRRALRITALLCLLLGLCLLLRPVVNRQLYDREATAAIEAFTRRFAPDSGVEAAEVDTDSAPDGEEWDALYERMVAYNRALFLSRQSGLVDPFSYEQVDFSLVELGFAEEMIGYLSIPAIDIELPIYLGASKTNMGRGAAHLTQTSLPVGGENTNAVLAGHRGYNGLPMFRNLHLLEVGDPVYITNFRETLEYRVAEIKIISPTDVGEILIQEGRDLVSLLTCNPLGQNVQRLLVICERV